MVWLGVGGMVEGVGWVTLTLALSLRERGVAPVDSCFRRNDGGGWLVVGLIDLYTGIVYNLYIHIANWRESAEAV